MKKTQKIKTGNRYSKYGYMFLVPFFLIYFLFQLYPLANTIGLSFVEYYKPAMGASIGPNFIGFGNYADIFNDVRSYGKFTYQAFRNTIAIWSISFAPQLILALILASLLTNPRHKIKGTGAYKVLIFMPNIMTAASISLLFYSLFSHPVGPVNMFLQNIGVLSEAYRFFDSIVSTRLIISFILFWMWYGNTMIILIAGITGISPSLYEAAEVDGASTRQMFFKITLPLLKPILLYTLITSLIGGMQNYDVPQLITRPGQISNDGIMTVTMYIQQLVNVGTKDFGHSAAVSVLLFILTGIISVILFYVMRDKEAVKERKMKKQIIKERKKQLKLQEAEGGVQ